MYGNVPDDMTLGEAKRIMRGRFLAKERFKCPCCNDWVGMSRRSIPGQHYAELVRLHLLPEGFHHKRDFMMPNTGGGDFTKLRYWDLIESKGIEPADDKTHSGFWRITDRGRLFVEQRLRLPKYAWDWNGNCHAFEGPEVSILDCLGSKFSYTELYPNRKPPTVDDRGGDDHGNLWGETGPNWHPEPG